MFKHAKLGVKFGGGFAVVAIVALGGGLLTHNSASHIRDDWNGYQTNVAKRQTLLMEIKARLGYGGAIHNFKNYVLRSSEAYHARTVAELAKISTAIAKYSTLASLEPAEKQALAVIQSTVDKYRAATDLVRTRLAQGNTVRQLDKEVKIDDAPAIAAFGVLNERYTRMTATNGRTLAARIDRTILWMLACGAVLIVVMMMWLLWARHAIGRPLGEIGTAARRVSLGDLGATIEYESGDEIGDVAAAFRDLIASQRQIAGAAQEIGRGDPGGALQLRSRNDALGHAMISMKESITRIELITTYARQLANGKEPSSIKQQADDLVGQLEHWIGQLGSTMMKRDYELQREISQSKFDGMLQRALDMTDDEDAALLVAERALESVLPVSTAELLLADPELDQLRRFTSGGSSGSSGHGCPVGSPDKCAAVKLGRTLRFSSSDALDACPQLSRHSKSPCAAVCVPISVVGRTIGVVHVVDPPHTLPHRDQIRLLEVIASQTGVRLGMLRTIESTSVAANTDVLTQLANRRSFMSNAASALRREPDGEHAVVMCDLDRFKRLNDEHGHAAGDRALRLFADTVRSGLRPTDIAGRYGGEEFTMLLPRCGEKEAVAVLERLRSRLAEATKSYGGPPFTASLGVAIHPEQATSLEELLKAADTALYDAKKNGRDQIVVCGRPPLPHGAPSADSASLRSV